MFKLEPIGSTLFSSDVIWDEKGHARISYIYVTFTDYGIKSIQFIYFHEGVHVESQKHGYFGGEHTIRSRQIYIQVKLENDEYLTALSGDHCDNHITSLTFHTNKGRHGPFCKRYSGYHKSFARKIDVGICDRSEFCGLYGSFSEKKYGGYLTSIGMYISHNRSIIDQVPRTSFGATYDHQFVRVESLDHTTPSGHYQYPNVVVDGFPVEPIRCRKSKLKDRILSKFNKAIQFLINL
ncbi:hypothetical protein YC2023_036800 [Brassica napus]